MSRTETPPWEAGQEVILEGRLAKIERITPSGRAVIGKAQFGKDGFQIGERSSWRTPRIEVPTPETRAKAIREGVRAVCIDRLEHVLGQVRMRTLDTDTMRAIIKALAPFPKDDAG